MNRNFDLNPDTSLFESFNNRKGRAPELPWKTADSFFVPKPLADMKEGKGRPSAPHGWNTRAVKHVDNPLRCGYYCFKNKY